MKNRLLLSLILVAAALFCTSTVIAKPAYNGVVTITQPDGSKLDILIHGDEYFNYKTTTDGYCIVRGEDGFYYYASLQGTQLRSIGVRAGGMTTRSGAAGASRGIPQNIAAEKAAQQRRARATEEPLIGKMTTRSENDVITTKTLVLLVEFAGQAKNPNIPSQFQTVSPKTSFNNLFNQSGYNRDGATGSVQDYYYENTNQHFRPQFDVYGPYKLPQTLDYYGENNANGDDRYLQQMIVDACAAADDEVDFSQYSTGAYINDIFVVYAGYDEAESGYDECIWPCRWSINGDDTFDGKTLMNFACSSELTGSSGTNMAPIGSFCHEFGHLVDLPDVYDTEYSNKVVTPRYLSLMDAGNYNNLCRTPPALSITELNIISRFLAGEDWGTVTTLDSGGQYSLAPLTSSFEAYRIETGNTGEYFLLETRSRNNKWDKYMAGGVRQIPTDGLIVYHIDQSNNVVYNGLTAKELWKMGKNLNTTPNHELYKVVRAAKTNDITMWFFPGQNITSLSENDSDFRAWGNDYNNISLTNMGRDGENVVFTLAEKSEMIFSGKVTNLLGEAVADASVFIIPTTDESREEKHDLFTIKQRIAQTTRSAAGKIYTTTDDKGEFSIENVSAGNYDIYISKKGHVDYFKALKLTALKSRLEATLNPYGMAGELIEGSLTDIYSYDISINNKLIGNAYKLSDLTDKTEPLVLIGAQIYLLPGTWDIVTFKNRTKVKTRPVTVQNEGYHIVDLSSHGITLNDKEDEVIVAIDIPSTTSVAAGTTERTTHNSLTSNNNGASWMIPKIKINNTDYYILWHINVLMGKSAPAEGINIDKTEVSLVTGDYEKLKYTLSPAGSSAEIKWSSDNENVARVDEEGVVMATGKGTAEITAEVAGMSSKVTVTVTKDEMKPLAAPSVDNDKMTARIVWEPDEEIVQNRWTVRWRGTWDEEWHMKESETRELELTDLLPNSTYEVMVGGERTYKPELYWGYRTTSFVTIQKPMAERIETEQKYYEMELGASLTIEATVMPNDAWNRELVWSSRNEDVATVDADGVVTAQKIGATVITAKTKYGNLSADFSIEILKGLGITPYENSVALKWGSDNMEGRWHITLSSGNTTVADLDLDETSAYIDDLAAGTSYKVAIVGTPTDPDKPAVELNGTFSTEPLSAPFPYIKGVKGRYAAGEKVTLMSGGIKYDKPWQSEWYINGSPYTPKEANVTLPRGRHTIVLRVISTEGGTDIITKEITIN